MKLQTVNFTIEADTVADVAALLALIPQASRPAPALVNGNGEKGEWEKAWIAKSGRKSVRFTVKCQASYPSKEAYCQALIEGTATDETEGDCLDGPAASSQDDGESFI